MSVTIKYKGDTIASANTDTTKTIKTSGKYCEADIEVVNTQDGGITPSGNINITENGTYDVTQYAEANVNVSGGTEITDGIVVKARDANGYATEVDYYVGDTCYPYQFYQGYRAASWNFDVNSAGVWRALQTINVIGKPKSISHGAFGYHPADIVADFSEVINIAGSTNNVDSNGVAFANAIGLTNITMSNLPFLTGAAFAGCTALSSVVLPKCATVYSPWSSSNSTAAFGGCVALTNVQLGSIGTECLLINNQAFTGCTNESLVVTLFCKGANADTQLGYIRNRATNATIIIKASEATTYGGTSYNAGDTMITSTP